MSRLFLRSPSQRPKQSPSRKQQQPTSTPPLCFLTAQHVIVDSGGGGGTQYVDETAETAGVFTGTVALGYNGTEVVGLRLDTSNNLYVNLNTAIPAGSNLIGQAEISDGTNVLFTSGHPGYIQGTVSIGSGPFAVNLTEVGGTSFALGQQLAAAALPVVLTAIQITALTPPTAAAIAAAIVANPPTVGVSGTVSVTQGTTPWIVAGGGTAGTPGTAVLTVQGISGGTTIPVTATIAASQTIAVTNVGTFLVQAEIEGHAGVALDAVLGATKPANVLQVGGNDGTNAYAIPLASGGGSIVVSGTFYQSTQPISIASGAVASGAFASGSIASGAIASGAIASGAIAAGAAAAGAFADGSVFVRSANASTFPVTATIAAAQTIAVTNAGTFVVQASIASAQKIEIYDGTNTATVKAASTAAVATDTALVVTEPGSTTAGACANDVGDINIFRYLGRQYRPTRSCDRQYGCGSGLYRLGPNTHSYRVSCCAKTLHGGPRWHWRCFCHRHMERTDQRDCCVNKRTRRSNGDDLMALTPSGSQIDNPGGGSGGVTSLNSETGAVTLLQEPIFQ